MSHTVEVFEGRSSLQKMLVKAKCSLRTTYAYVHDYYNSHEIGQTARIPRTCICEQSLQLVCVVEPCEGLCVASEDIAYDEGHRPPTSDTR